MKVLALALIALAGCTTQEWRCPNCPKVVATFNKGDHVAFTTNVAVWDSHSTPEEFTVHKGDTGIIIDINYWGDPIDTVEYIVSLDKAEMNQLLRASALETVDNCWIKAVVYPDPALSPGRK